MPQWWIAEGRKKQIMQTAAAGSKYWFAALNELLEHTLLFQGIDDTDGGYLLLALDNTIESPFKRDGMLSNCNAPPMARLGHRLDLPANGVEIVADVHKPFD